MKNKTLFPPFDDSDDAVARDLAHHWNGDVGYVETRRSWYLCDTVSDDYGRVIGSIWRLDEKLEHVARARDFLRETAERLRREAAEMSEQWGYAGEGYYRARRYRDSAPKLLTERKLNAVLRLVRCDPRIARAAEEMVALIKQNAKPPF